MLIIKDILQKRRQYFIEKVKAPLLKAIHRFNESSWVVRVFLLFEIIKLSRKYPEPTEDTLIFSNSKRLLKIKQRHWEYHNNPSRRLLIDIFLKLVIDQNEHDGYYGFIGDFIVLEYLKLGWQPEKRGFPMYRYWKGPLNSNSFLETNPEWLIRRREELLKKAEEDYLALEERRANGTLWYDRLDKIPKLRIPGPGKVAEVSK